MPVYWIAAAAQAVTISASPVVITSENPPGTSTEHTVTISNSSSQPLEFLIEVYDLGLDDAGNQGRFPQGSLDSSMASWLTILKPRFTVPADDERKAGLVISVPHDAAGGHQAALVFRTLAQVEQSGGEAVQVGAGIAVKIFHSTLETANRSLQVVESRVTPPSAHDLASVYLLVRNSGEAFLRAIAETAILDGTNGFVGRGVSKPTKVLIPGETAPLSVEWGGELPRGIYSALTTVVFNGGSIVLDEQFTVPNPQTGSQSATE